MQPRLHIGQLALVLGLAVLLSFYARKRLGTRAWRSIHYLSFVAFVGATAHGIMAGSDSEAARVVVGYAVLIAAVVFLTTYRLLLALAGRVDDRVRQERPASSEPPSAGRAGSPVSLARS